LEHAGRQIGQAYDIEHRYADSNLRMGQQIDAPSTMQGRPAQQS
jgi:hypothetical protein